MPLVCGGQTCCWPCLVRWNIRTLVAQKTNRFNAEQTLGVVFAPHRGAYGGIFIVKLHHNIPCQTLPDGAAEYSWDGQMLDERARLLLRRW
jgi:hypothetical protein